ncbi:MULTISPECIES: ABC transporter ATP-binding protein [unclassified Streptomyces]|uniref:ABC transporter ATP-binding protein n=1 Tax=unclassified Streptomyces TaxID=2593676 RepID=UPI0037F39F2C
MTTPTGVPTGPPAGTDIEPGGAGARAASETESPMTEQTSRRLLEVDDLHVHLGSPRRHILRGVSLSVPAGAVLGLVGESGSGKSTLAKTLVGVHRPSGGAVRFDGRDCLAPGRRERARLRRDIQYVPQDPYSSLDPRRTIGQTIAEALDPRRARVGANLARITELLETVQLDGSAVHRYPREFSGGQRQRVAIARALAVRPSLVIADEITSALDLSTQAEVLDLLARLKESIGLTLVFVSHDLAVVRSISDSVLVLLHGEVVESGPTRQVFEEPRAEYTRTLIDSAPGGPGFSLD